MVNNGVVEKNLFYAIERLLFSEYYIRMRLCFYCNYKLDDTVEIYRTSTCPSCSKDLKVCKNCEFFHPGSHWDCQETIEEPVQDKDRANYCPYFAFKDSKPGEVISYKAKRDARKKFNKLFSDES